MFRYIPQPSRRCKYNVPLLLNTSHIELAYHQTNTVLLRLCCPDNAKETIIALTSVAFTPEV